MEIVYGGAISFTQLLVTVVKSNRFAHLHTGVGQQKTKLGEIIEGLAK